MTNQELQTLVERISKQSFAKPFRHRAYFNARLRTTGGRYHLNTHDIDINPKMVGGEDNAVLIGIIKHELCHYHLHLAGYSGNHGSRAFKQLLKAVGGSRYAPRLNDHPQPYRYLYRCSHCGLVYHRKRRIDLHKFVCGRCHGQLQLVSDMSA